MGDLWLDSWCDLAANLRAFSSGLAFQGDRLCVGDLAGTLKIFRNGKVEQAVRLNAVPSAVCSYFEDTGPGVVLPVLAVACGSSVKVLKNFKPYYRFVVPPKKLEDSEVEAWKSLKSGEKGVQETCISFRSQKILSKKARTLLGLENEPEKLATFLAEQLDNEQFREPDETCVTCMDVLHLRADAQEDGPGCLVLGTETCNVLLLDPMCRNVEKSISLPSEPVFLAVSGSKDVEYRIVVACRNQRIYSIKDGDLMRNCIEMASPIAAGVVRIGRNIVFACLDKTVHSYHFRGKKNWTMYMQDKVTNLSLFQNERTAEQGFFVALKTGEVRLYMEKTLMCTIEPPSPKMVVTGLCFGKLNGEGNTLGILYTSGAFSLKILKRSAKLDPSQIPLPGPPAEQDIPLEVPKKTKLYLEQTERERENAVAMHQSFQQSLAKVRYVAAKTYLRLFENAGVANSQLYTSSYHRVAASDNSKPRINMMVSVQGLGPKFRISCIVRNLSSAPLTNIHAAVQHDYSFFDIETPFKPLPVLIPQIEQTCDIEVDGIMPGAEAPPITIALISQRGTTLLVANVEMPVVEET